MNLPFFVVLLSTLKGSLAVEENIALHKPVLADARWPECLTDGNMHSTISPHATFLPTMTVDLRDTYQLTSIHVHAQNEWSFYNQGLNIPFSVYTWNEFTSGCDLISYYPWNLVKGNMTFTKKGQEIVLDGLNITAQFIIVLPDKKGDLFEIYGGMPMGQLRAFGKKIKSPYTSAELDNEPEEKNKYTETRHALLTGQKYIFVEMSYTEYKVMDKYEDIAIGWLYGKINTLAIERSKARVIIMSGTTGLKRLQKASDYKNLRANFKKWLNPNNPESNFVSVSKAHKAGDILIITRKDKFNVEDIYTKLTSGENSAVIGYEGSIHEPQDNATTLMKKLEVAYQRHHTWYAERNLYIDKVINSHDYIPYEYPLKQSVKSWKFFKSYDLRVQFTLRESKDKEMQELVSKIVKKYFNYFTHNAVCPVKAYVFNNETDIAMVNYNKMLQLQHGEKVTVAPGAAYAPGQVHPSMKPTSYSVTFKIDVGGSFFPMAGYAKPGEAFHYTVTNCSKPNLNGFNIRINPQTDYVPHVYGYRRWPSVTKSQALEMEGMMVSAFGGPIVLQIPANTEITIKFENVYRYAFLDMRNPETRKNWAEEVKKYEGVPYSMIFGDNMISMIQTPMFKMFNLDNITWAINFYDNVVKIMHNYRGTDLAKSRQEVFVTDDQLSIGWGHSGYPWMGYRAWAYNLLDAESAKKGHEIGSPHEIGHNLQVGGITLRHGNEVTNNMYIPVVNKYLLGKKSYDKGSHPGCGGDDDKGAISAWKSREYNGVQLVYYNYLGRNFGPAMLSNVLHKVMVAKEPLNNDEQKINFMVKHFCIESGRDLVPFHRLWSFPMSQATVTACSEFPCWFPDDYLTQQIPELAAQLKTEHGRNCTSETLKEVAFKLDIMRGIDKTKPQAIFIH